MDNTNTPQPVTPAPMEPSAPPVSAMPQTPMSPPVNQAPASGGNGDATKLLMVVLIVVVLLGCGIGGVVLYKQMNATKAPATNYVVDTPVSVAPTEAEPTVPPVLSQPVAEDASGIDNEIKILDETVNSTDSTTIKTEDIQNVTQ
jgi:uncharacterized protein HemX